MRKGLYLAVTLAALVALVLAPDIASAKGKGGGGGKKDGTMTVQIREAIVRATPNYLGPQAGKLAYGAQVKSAGEEGNWYKIESPSGFIPKSAVTSGKVASNPDGKAGSGGSHNEVALAGKGLGPEIETQYRKDNPSIAQAFAAVDRVENYKVPESRMRQFQQSGKLKAR